MRNIKVSTDIFAEIWSQRQEGEHSEDQILRRMLLGQSMKALPPATRSPSIERQPSSNGRGKVRWVDDILEALACLGGTAHLSDIYREVRRIRTENGRSIPPTFEEVVRKELETHSRDSDAFQHREDYFCLPEGKGAGVWALMG